MKSGFNKILGAALLSLCCAAPAFSQQNYDFAEESLKWEAVFQAQDAIMCGQTCIYMITHYYGYGEPNDTDQYQAVNSWGYWETFDLTSYDDSTDVWLRLVYGGLPIERTTFAPGALSYVEQIRIKATKVHLFNDRIDAEDAGYNTGTDLDDAATFDDSKAKEDSELGVRETRLAHIKANFLDRGLPAVFLVRKENDSTGHYMVMAGYGTDDGVDVIYYMNPNKDASDDVLQSISEEEFLTDFWYDADSNGNNGRRWNGKWFAFYPLAM